MICLKKHDFSFPGGALLSRMGASWFISYSYYEKINKTHKNWSLISTVHDRISKYKQGTIYHEVWLKKVLEMNPVNLNKNQIELDAQDVFAMARELLNHSV